MTNNLNSPSNTTTCPSCHKTIFGIREPLEPGNLLVCQHCTSVIYTQDGLELSLPDRRIMDSQPPEVLQQLTLKRKQYLKELGGVVFRQGETLFIGPITITILTTNTPKEDGILVEYAGIKDLNQLKTLLHKIRKAIK